MESEEKSREKEILALLEGISDLGHGVWHSIQYGRHFDRMSTAASAILNLSVW